MFTLTLTVVFVVLVAVVIRATWRDTGARARYWGGIADIIDDPTLTPAERDAALEDHYAARPF